MMATRRSRSSRPGSRPPTRPYDSSRRVAASEVTRRGIIEAVHRMLGGSQAPRLSLEDVAAESGVTRPTLYNLFGSRRGLLVSVMEDLGRAIRYDRVQAAQQLADPRRALHETIREACACWSSGRDAIRRILAIGALDHEIADLNARFESYRRAECAALATRLIEAGLVGAGITRLDAEVMLGAMTGPQAFALLGGDDDPAAACARLTRTVFASLGIPTIPE